MPLQTPAMHLDDGACHVQAQARAGMRGLDSSASFFEQSGQFFFPQARPRITHGQRHAAFGDQPGRHGDGATRRAELDGVI
ncbi:hypothetical protein D3C81_2039030 [compost metagenome]